MKLHLKLSFVVLISTLVFSGMLFPAQDSYANHQWGKYHWGKTENTLTLTILDRHINGLVNWSDLLRNNSDSVVDKWDYYSGDYLTFQTDTAQGNIESFNGNYGDNGWLGLASISILKGKHIVAGKSYVNDFYISAPGYYGFDEPIEWQHVLCQEIGHTFGLDHNRNGDTCMNDYLRPLRFSYPNDHDEEQLNIMYEHLHGDGGGGGGKTPKCHPKFGCTGAHTHATWAEHYESETEMFNASDLVVSTTVVSSSFNRMVGRADRAIPVTRVVLKVTETLKGSGKKVIFLEQTRGPKLELEDDPGYVTDDNYYLYLRQTGSNTYRIVNPDGRIKN